MNIETIAKKWLIEHEHYEDEPTFKDDLASLCKLIEDAAYHEGYLGYGPDYDPNFGDDKLCKCGHPYYRHFDTYDDMAPVGCKYCFVSANNYDKGNCAGFKEKA